MSKKFLTVSDAARELNVRPRDISDLFYQRRLPDDFCPLVGGRRLIPAEQLPTIRAAWDEKQEQAGATAIAAKGTQVFEDGVSGRPTQE